MSGFDTGLDIFKIFAFIFPIIFVLVFAGIFFALIKGLKQWNYNNKQPKLTVPAKIVTKRIDYIKRNDMNQFTHSATHYYVTLEVESGDRIEFQVDGFLYGQLVENDSGKLTFQGTRFINFERQ
ncbi:DUF2500 domain-containing protein [Bacillus sp. AFS041924]|uniref:DUF2500 domain-containing protein n=1 Tax=Bacillus sp. AFS041924 TaxID=2033503 RepID=UPI000BFC3AA2|nr:DUF2500 domain-containing protein [Bacillus sp. AFS041924]PGS55380.1 hypothetical protein COC46_03505 [Bacillus sp. AFS041924]